MKCTEFGTYIVTGCRSLTRIEATAAGNFVDISDGRSSIERTAVGHHKPFVVAGDFGGGIATLLLIGVQHEVALGGIECAISVMTVSVVKNEWLMMPTANS